MIKTAVIGASGFIGRHLLAFYRARFPDCVGTSFARDGVGLKRFDIRKPNIAALALAETGHEAVLIASGKSNVHFCESNREASREVNVNGTVELARQASRIGLKVIFLSSDYVFDGKNAPFSDAAPTHPTNEYGRQKEAVEKAIADLTDNFMVLRLSKIYGLKKGDGTLLDEMAATLSSGAKIKAAHDQYFCPTYIGDVVEAVDRLQSVGAKGLMNLCSAKGWSRYELATALADAMRVSREAVEAVSLHSIPHMDVRPLDTRMLPSKIVLDQKPAFLPLCDSIQAIALAWKPAA